MPRRPKPQPAPEPEFVPDPIRMFDDPPSAVYEKCNHTTKLDGKEVEVLRAIRTAVDGDGKEHTSVTFIPCIPGFGEYDAYLASGIEAPYQGI